MWSLRRRDLLLGGAGLVVGCAREPAGDAGAGTGQPLAQAGVVAQVAWPRIGRGAAIGIGTGTRGGRGRSDQTRLGDDALLSLLRAANERGLSYVDSADEYGTHPAVRALLREVPRERVQVLTKTQARDGAGATADLERMRLELGCDQIDVVLMHRVEEADWPDLRPGVLDALLEARSRGLVRAVGVSCHGIEALRTAVRTEGIDVHLVRLNPQGLRMDAAPAEVLPLVAQMRAAGRMVIGMKVFGGGQMRTPEARRASLAWAWAEAGVHAVTVGIASPAELEALVTDAAGVFAAGGAAHHP